MLTTLNVVLLLNAMLVGVGIYLSSYLKKKAEHLATREDFKELRAQTAALTQTTKEIEAAISGDLWDRQKRWELKRDIVFETTKAMTKVAHTVGSLNAVYNIKHNPSDQAWIDESTGKGQEFLNATKEFDSVGIMIAIVCDESTIETVDAFSDFSRDLAKRIVDGDTNIYTASQYELWHKVRIARKAFRIELGIDKKI